MINNFFKKVTKLHKAGGNNTDSSVYCFGLLNDESFFKNEVMNNEEVAEKIARSYSGYSNFDLGKETEGFLKNINKNYGYDIVLMNFDYADALMFNRKISEREAYREMVKEQSEKTEVKLIGKTDESILGKVPEDVLTVFDEIYDRPFSSPFKEDFTNHFNHFKEVSRPLEDNPNVYKIHKMNYLNIGRVYDNFSSKSPFHYDKILKDGNIGEKDILSFIFHHETAHSFFDDSVKGDYTNHCNEAFADTYAAVMSIKSRKDTKMAEFLSDFRNNNLLKNTFQRRPYRLEYEEAVFMTAYHTAPAIDGVIKEYSENPDKFNKKYDHEQTINLVYDILAKHDVDENTLNSLGFEISTRCVQGNLTEALKKREQFFAKNGLSLEENNKIWNDLLNSQEKKVKRKERKEINTEISEKLKSGIKTEMVENGKSYDIAFLDAYSKNVNDTISKYYSDPKAKHAYEYLHNILKSEKNVFKPEIMTSNNAFESFVNQVDLPLSSRVTGKESIDAYVKNKTSYNEAIQKVIKDIKDANITEQTKTTFKEALVAAKMSHFNAKSAEAFLNENPDFRLDRKIATSVKADALNPYPVTLDKIFKNKIPFKNVKPFSR